MRAHYDVPLYGEVTVSVSRFEFERIDLAITSLMANQPVASEQEHTRDQCKSAAVNPPANLSFLFLSLVSKH